MSGTEEEKPHVTGAEAAESAEAAEPAEAAESAGAADPQRAATADRPADEARRALRAARKTAAADDHSAAGAGSAAGEGSGSAGERAADAEGGARPGDVARGALRAAGASAVRAATAEPAATGRSGGEAGGGARPGDIAREALRAARRLRSQEAEGDDGQSTVDDGKGVGPRGRSARTSPAGARARRDPERPVTPERVSQQRQLRDLLADAFRLPPDLMDETGEPSGPSDDTGEASRDRTHDQAHDRPAPPGPIDHPEPVTRPERSSYLEHLTHPGSPTSAESPTSSANFTSSENPTPPVPEREYSADAEPFTVGSLGLDFLTAGPGTEAREPGVPHRSMASPRRDGELRRTFPAFPARVHGDGGFAETWWGNAWVTALEEGALDTARLARGRTYAGQGYVDAVTVTPGLVLAYVHGSRPRPYRVQVRVRTLTDGDWDRFLDAAAERPGHIAALLDKEMPRSLADCGVDLLPGPGELEPHCSCPDFGHPCKHAAALCYQTARLLDQDPFVLFLLRGRGERELLDALSRRNATRAARAAQEREPAQPAGVRARDALARRVPPPLPAPLPPPAHPEQPPAYPGAPGGPDAFALDQLATDAAARAYTLLTSGRDPVAELTLWQDAVRLAAARPGSGLTAATRALYSSLASATGRTPIDLARAVAAWRQGGFEALGVLEEPWDPPAGRFDRARPLLMAADLPAFRPWRNHLTHPSGHAQLRLGRNGLWYAYESEPGHDDWWPRGTPDLDPVGALTGLGAPDEL
ncbi:SWIM zinc finger family protein [Streptomyces sp. NPDC002667]|uniref:SWIM zinc finger family protein n=1 Tax=Streptomyces sp. NPDC002667 TaxID=3364657 RepID=UPI00368DFDC9